MAENFKIATAPQLALFEPADTPQTQAPTGNGKFVEDSAGALFVGGRRLDEYLREARMNAPLSMRTLLRGLDWNAFTSRYSRRGRYPYAPWAMVGLVLYGILKGVTSLRQMEALARVDLGCMWVCGGIAPDHSAIGRFLLQHRDTLSGEFFEQLTAAVFARMKGDASELAGDGTVIQAAASRYRKLDEEAAAQAAVEAQQAAEASPDDEKAQQKAERARQAAEAVKERAAARKAKGRDPSHAVVSPTEPEAAVQQMKNKAVAPSYKPSAVVNSQRLILGKGVHATSETAVLDGMLEQAERLTNQPAKRVMLDAGYNSAEVLAGAIAKGIDLLCPEGKTHGDGCWEKKGRYFTKARFEYDSDADTYRCPNGMQLHFYQRCHDKGQAVRRYRCDDCAGCPIRNRCTSSVHGRTIKRYQGDEAKEALREVMRHPEARALYRRRQGWVEPVFGEIRSSQGLNRFRRRGHVGVELEWSLHAAAHNIRRMLACVGRSPLLAPLLALLSQIWAFLAAGRQQSAAHVAVATVPRAPT
ncbi:MAG: IS1182 family transposase [bacterium]|nr:IS1182 family transposase [bacterium]